MLPESFTLAAAQVGPVYHDKEGTLDKTCRWIERAGDEGADLVVFPETYFSGYPSWQWSVSYPRWTDLVIDLQKNSLHVDDEAVDVLLETADEADVTVVLGTNEIDDRRGSGTLYNSIFYLSNEGEFLGRHRKLVPTHEERAIWGRGDPSSLRTYETNVGTVGGLVCWENHMTLSKAALCAEGEEVHAALWPGFWTQNGHPGDTPRAASADAKETSDIYPAMREYAFANQAFVVSCSTYMSQDPPDGFTEDELGHNVAAGGSMLVNPAGIVKEGPVVGEEALLVADFERDERRAMKAYFDAMGHYSRWDAISLHRNDTTLEPVHEHHRDGLSAARALDIAESNDVDVELVEQVAEALR